MFSYDILSSSISRLRASLVTAETGVKETASQRQRSSPDISSHLCHLAGLSDRDADFQSSSSSSCHESLQYLSCCRQVVFHYRLISIQIRLFSTIKATQCRPTCTAHVWQQAALWVKKVGGGQEIAIFLQQNQY